jgi:hypothetical protein
MVAAHKRRGLRITMDGLVGNNRHDSVMLANIVVHDRAHLGFRAIYETANIRFLSGVIWGKSWVTRWRHC